MESQPHLLQTALPGSRLQSHQPPPPLTRCLWFRKAICKAPENAGSLPKLRGNLRYETGTDLLLQQTSQTLLKSSGCCYFKNTPIQRELILCFPSNAETHQVPRSSRSWSLKQDPLPDFEEPHSLSAEYQVPRSHWEQSRRLWVPASALCDASGPRDPSHSK